MKKLITLFLLIFSLAASAQNIQLTLTPSVYGSYNIRCFGDYNGSIDLTITGGVSPYTILWNTGATTEDLANIPAGFYTVDVTDNNNETVRGEITLRQPPQLRATLTPYV